MDSKISAMLNLDLDLAPLKKEAQDKLNTWAQRALETKLQALFHDPKDQAAFAHALSRGSQNDPDLSYCFKKIDELIAGMALGSEFDEFIQDYIEKQYPVHMMAALDKAMAHHAAKKAFSEVNKLNQ